MGCTRATPAPAIAPALAVAPPSLLAAFAAGPDPRRRASVAYPLPAALGLVLVAILARQLSLLAIAEWAARQGAPVLTPLGLAPGRTPCQSTLQRLFARLDAARLVDALAAHFQPGAAPAPMAGGGQGVAIDGKAQRGRLRFQAGGAAPSTRSPPSATSKASSWRRSQSAAEPICSAAGKAEAFALVVGPTRAHA